jgi:hypothetical protein
MNTKPFLNPLALIFLLASCSQPSAPAATFIQSTTLTSSLTATTAITQTATNSPSPKNTRAATITPWFSPTSGIDRVATIASLFTKVKSFPGHCQPDYVYYGSATTYDSPISPDGDWVIYPCQTPSQTRLEVMRLDGTKTWSITQEEILSTLSWRPEIYDVFPIHWTKDSQQVYFFIYFCCIDSSGVPPFGTNDGPLYHLDVQTGNWAPVVAIPENNPDSYTYSFSPTDRRLLYIQSVDLNKPLHLNILDLKTGILEKVNIPGFFDGGRVIWSPDGLTFALGVVHADETYKIFSFSVMLYQIKSKTLKSIITFSQDMCWPTEWSEDSLLVLSCVQYAPDYGSVTRRYIINYELNTSSLFTPSLTP